MKGRRDSGRGQGWSREAAWLHAGCRKQRHVKLMVIFLPLKRKGENQAFCPTETRMKAYGSCQSELPGSSMALLMKYGQWRARWAQGEAADLMRQFLR